MKQLLSLFIFLLPCLAWAQYPSNGNQKITLGEQSTADGLIYRGVAADTTLTAKSDTAAYFVLDTANLNLYTYKASATGRKWRQLGADTAAIAYVNTYGTQTVNGAKTFTTAPTFSTALGVASGGTGATSFSPNNYLIRTNSSGIFDTSAVYEAGGNVGIGTNTPNYLLDIWSTNSNVFNTLRLRNPFTGASDGSEILLGNSQNFTNAYFRLNGGGNNSQAGTGSLNIGVTQSSALALYTANTNRLHITSGGLIGIGNANPNYSLDLGTSSGGSLTSIRINNAFTGASDGSEILLGNSQNFTNAYFRLNGGGNNSQAGTGSLNIGVTQSSGLALYTSNTNRLYITSSGLIGIGTTSLQSGYRLHVVDSVYVGGNVSASAYTTRSDYNLKDDIFDLKYGLNDVLKLQPVEYTYKSNGSKQLGFIAQDIGTILPEVVSFEESMSVNYQAIIPILTKAIQEQNALIKALEQRIINLENK
jgi:hypothetical protein